MRAHRTLLQTSSSTSIQLFSKIIKDVNVNVYLCINMYVYVNVFNHYDQIDEDELVM